MLARSRTKIPAMLLVPFAKAWLSTAVTLEMESKLNADNSPCEAIRILLIEDDPSYRLLCQRYLAKDTEHRYEVVEAGSAADGIAECHETKYDCLLIDYSLPDQTGVEIIRELTHSLGECAPPCIILTADGGSDAAAEALRAGAADFLPKRHLSTNPLSRSIKNAVEKGRLKQSVAERTLALEIANDALKSRNDEIQRFYQNISHEVKTPLAAAREFIAIVLDGIVGPVTDDQQEMLIHAVESCDQITGHFNDLVEMTRLESKKIALNRQPASLNAVAIRCFAATKSACHDKNISLQSENDESLPLMSIDRNRIIQVISNLLGNAIKFTSENGTVTLSIRYYTDESSVDIVVSDTGCGIAEEHLPHIFDRLYQVENAHDEFTGAGLGLGLSIAKEIVMLHEGKMWADSVVGEGTTFTVRLPVEPCNELEMT
jgi:signal transduction histidine kinase